MATNNLKGVHTISNTREKLKDFLLKVEGNRSHIYADSKGIPTIGIGYAFNKDISKIIEDLKNAGYTVSAQEKKNLVKLLDAKNNEFAKTSDPKQRKKQVQAHIDDYYNASDNIVLDTTQIKNLLDTILPGYETPVKTFINGTNITENSDEYIALVSLNYNGVFAGSDSLKFAIKNNNRAEAWYEIRYNTNYGTSRGRGIANRRVKESNMFHLYPSSNTTEDDYKQIFNMYTKHKNKIISEENEFKSSYDEYDSFYKQTLTARNFLVNKYANLSPINGDILVGNNTDDDTFYGDFYNETLDDTLRGTTKNDLIFGEAGNDTLNGNGGSDVMYGGIGNDTIDGGTGNDFLFGEADSDTLNGNAGNDHLEGGIGSDTLHGGADSDTLLGGTETDYLYGDSGNDTLLGGDDKSTDILFGGSGEDTLLGQGGDDVLAGGVSWDNLYGEKESDYLLGGSGYDVYYVSNSDTINDADYAGLIMFNDKSLGGKKRKVDDTGTTYEDDYFVYALNGNDMVVVEKATQEYITIENFNFHSVGFGIDFSQSDPNKQDIELKVSDATTTEGGDLVFNVSINHALKYDLTVDVASYFNGSADEDDLKNPISGTVTIPAGAVSAEFTISTIDDTIKEPTEKFIFAATGYKYAGENQQDNDLGSLLIVNAGEGTIKDNETKTPLEVSVSDASLDEANAMMTFTVSLKGVLEDGETLTVDFQTADNTATASYDYASTTKSITFTKDSMTQTIEVPIYDDSYKEGDETFWLTPVSTSGYNGNKGVNNIDFKRGEVA